MITTEAPVLDFSVLDGLAFAAERGRLERQGLPILYAGELGPVLELARLTETQQLPLPSAAPWLALNDLAPFIRALSAGDTSWVCRQTRRRGFLRTRDTAAADDSAWIAFGLAAQKAASAAGFHHRVAAQLTAALGELRSNIYEHSQVIRSGLLAFQSRAGCFEFVAFDAGVGVLESLRSGSGDQSPRDHGEALRLALTDGVSRFGTNTGRGHGFRPIFVGLANLQGRLRFRSGDHALLIDGQSPSLVSARIAQKASLRGFVASVLCEAQPVSRPKNRP